MSQTDVVDSSLLGAIYFRTHASFATGGTLVRIYPVAGSVEWNLDQEQINVFGQRIRPNDTRAPVKGRKSGKAGFELMVQANAVYLNVSATPQTTDPLIEVLQVATGVAPSFAVGGTLNGSPTKNSWSLLANGTSFPAGQLGMIQNSSAPGGYDVVRILTQVTNALTSFPDTTSDTAPSSGNAMICMVTYYPSFTNTKSGELVVCNAQDSNLQALLTGCRGEFQISFKQGDVVKLKVDLEAATWTAMNAAGNSIAHVEDPLMEPFSVVDSVAHFAAITTATRNSVTMDSVDAKLTWGTQFTETLTAGTQGKRGVVLSKDLEKPAAMLEIVVPIDTAYDTGYVAGTVYGFLWSTYMTDVNSKVRKCALDLPRLRQVAPPARVKGSDGLMKYKLTLQADRDQSCTGSTTALATAPWRFAVG